MTIIKAAAVQISPVLYSREGTIDRVVQKILELGREGVQFATFPETIVPYYPYFSFVTRPFEMVAEHIRLLEQSVTVPSEATRAIAEASQASRHGGGHRRQRARRRHPLQCSVALRCRRHPNTTPPEDYARHITNG